MVNYIIAFIECVRSCVRSSLIWVMGRSIIGIGEGYWNLDIARVSVCDSVKYMGEIHLM
jgi:hypothetical protein